MIVLAQRHSKLSPPPPPQIATGSWNWSTNNRLVTSGSETRRSRTTFWSHPEETFHLRRYRHKVHQHSNTEYYRRWKLKQRCAASPAVKIINTQPINDSQRWESTLIIQDLLRHFPVPDRLLWMCLHLLLSNWLWLVGNEIENRCNAQ